MANERSLLIKLLGDATGMKNALSEADTAVGKHDLSLKNLAGTIGSAYAADKVIDFSRASIEAAAADEASQVTLATQLRNTTAASDAQIASVERWITKTMFATNTADDELRPALARLVTSTGDVSTAQDLMGVAIDTAKGKGISLETAANALARAHDGNTSALGRMGIATKDAEGKTLSFETIVKNLSETFSGQAAAAAETQAGKLANMKLRYGELQEQIGTALMPIMSELVGVLSGVAEWFSSLDEDTQAWIVRIGMLGGGLVLATRAVNGIVGPLKQMGIIGKAAEGSTGSLVSKIGGLAAAAPLATAALGLAVLGAIAYKDALDNDAEAAKAASEAIGGFLTALSLEDFRKKFAEWSWDIVAQGKHVSNNFDDMARQDLVAAKALRDSGVVMEKSAEWQKALADAINLVEREQQAATDRTEKYTTATKDGTEAAGKAKTAQDVLTSATAGVTAAQQTFADMMPGLRAGLSLSAASVDLFKDSLNTARDAANNAKNKQFDLHTEMYKVKAAAEAQETAWSNLFGKYDEDTAFLNIASNFDSLKTKITDTEAAMKAGTTSQEQGMRDVAVEIIKTKKEVSEYIEKLGGVPASKATEINAMIDKGEYDAVEKALAWLTRKRDMGVTVTFTDRGNGAVLIGPKQALDDGGVVGGPRGSPQLVLAHGGETFIPTHKSGYAPIGAGGGTTVIENHFHGPVMGEQDFIRRLEEGRQDMIRRGAVLVPT